MSFLAELKRGNVFKFGLVFAIVALLLIQIASILLPTFNATRGPNNSNTATNEYVLGRTLYLSLTIENTTAGIDHLLQAVEIDPAYLHAWMTLSDAYRMMSLMSASNMDEWIQKSQDAAERILVLAPDSEFATRLVGMNHIDLGEWIEAQRILKRPQILESESELSKGLDISYGQFLLSVGMIREAAHYLERANRTDPLAGVVYSHLGKAYAAMNDFERSFEILDLYKVQANKERWHPLIRKTALFVALATNNQQLIKARAIYILETDLGAGEIDTEIQELTTDKLALGTALRRLWLEPSNQFGFRAETIAYWAAYVGDYDLTHDALRGLPNDLATIIFWQPVMKEFRKHTGFKDLVHERGIVDYWRATGKWGDLCHPVSEDDFECE